MIELPRAALMAGEIAETRRVLLVRHQRPDADDLRHLPRRRGERSSAPTRPRASCRPTRSCRSTARASASWSRSAAERGRKTQPEHQARHLRRARRRPGLGRVLPRDRPRLRVVLAVPRADRAARRGAGRAGSKPQAKHNPIAAYAQMEHEVPSERGSEPSSIGSSAIYQYRFQL